MNIIKIEERSDGGANIECEFTEEEIKILLNYAVNKMIRNHIKTIKEEVKKDE